MQHTAAVWEHDIFSQEVKIAQKNGSAMSVVCLYMHIYYIRSNQNPVSNLGQKAAKNKKIYKKNHKTIGSKKENAGCRFQISMCSAKLSRIVRNSYLVCDSCFDLLDADTITATLLLQFAILVQTLNIACNISCE